MAVLILSLFPGIGLLDMAFEEQGWCVVRGPDLIWGGDIKRFHPPAGPWDGVIGGPPCQQFSPLARLVKSLGYELRPNCIPDFERCVREGRPSWFLMENVVAAPEPEVWGYSVRSVLVCNRDVGGVQRRERRFSFGVAATVPVDLWRWLELEPLCQAEVAGPVLASGGESGKVRVVTGADGCTRRRVQKNGSSRALVARSLELQGLPADFFAQAPFTVAGQQRALGEGVPLPLGRAIAKAVRAAVEAGACGP